MRSSTDKSLFEQIRRAAARRKLLIAAVFAPVVISGMTATFLITPKYEAAMSILVSRDRVDSRISPSEKNPDTASSSISDEEFNSELELIKSGEVITGVVRELDLTNNQAPKNDDWISRWRTKIKTLFDGFTLRTAAETEAGQQNEPRRRQQPSPRLGYSGRRHAYTAARHRRADAR